MSRPLRIVYAGAWYHVINRGRRRERIFRDDADMSRFLELLKETRGLFRCSVAAYCLIPNHYHLLLQTLEPNLPRCMKHVDGVHTQRFNKRHGCDGQLFRGRYKALLVDSDSYLIDVVKYIHLNPKKAGLEQAPGEYPWTSHQAYLSNAARWDWISSERALGMIAADPGRQRQAYREFMKGDEREEVSAFYSAKNLRSVLGGSEFVQWVKDSFSDAIYREGVTNIEGLRCSIEDVLSSVSLVFGVSSDEIVAVKQSASNEARDVAMALARRYTGLPSRSIARSFGVRWGSTVCGAESRVEDSGSKDPELRRKVAAVENRLKKPIM